MNIPVFFFLLCLAAAIGWSAHVIYAFFTTRGMSAGELRARLEQMHRSIDHIHSKVSDK